MGHGRRVLNASAGLSGRTHQAGLSRRSGAPDPKDSFASLLDMRGGMGGLDDGNVWRSLGDTEGFRDRNTRRAGQDDVRGGYVESVPMVPQRSRGALRARRADLEFEDLDDYDFSDEGANVGMRQAVDMAGVYGTRSPRSMYGSASQVRPSIARHGDTEDLGDRNMRSAQRGYTDGFRDSNLRTARSTRGRYTESPSMSTREHVRSGSLRMKPSRSRGARHTTRAAVDFEDLDDFRGQGANIGMRQAANVEAVYGTRRPRSGLQGRVRQDIDRFGDTEDFDDLDDFRGQGANMGMRQAVDMEEAYGTRSPRSMYGSASQVRPSIARHGDTEDFGDWNMRRPWSEEFDDVRGVYVEPLPMTPSRSRGWLHSPRAAVEFEDLDDFRGQGANIGMRQAAAEAVYGTRRLRSGLLGRVRQSIARVGDTEDFRDSNVRISPSTPGGRVEFADLEGLRGRGGYIENRQADDIEAVYETRRLRRAMLGMMGFRDGYYGQVFTEWP